MLTGWTALFLAGAAEVGFTTFMKLSENFTRPVYTALFALSAALSFYLLSRAMTSIPLGTAYAVWTGIGAVGTVIVGIVFFGDPSSLIRVFFLLTLIGSIAGLKLLA